MNVSITEFEEFEESTVGPMRGTDENKQANHEHEHEINSQGNVSDFAQDLSMFNLLSLMEVTFHGMLKSLVLNNTQNVKIINLLKATGKSLIDEVKEVLVEVGIKGAFLKA